MKCHKRGIICEEVALVQALEELKTVGFGFLVLGFILAGSISSIHKGKKYRGKQFSNQTKRGLVCLTRSHSVQLDV